MNSNILNTIIACWHGQGEVSKTTFFAVEKASASALFTAKNV